MCLILLAWHQHPQFPLVIAANRDEFFARPTAALDWWPDAPLCAGRDLQAGGSWLAAGRSGRIAALTNFRDPARQRADAPSRGHMVPDFVCGEHSVAQHFAALQHTHARYNGFNLLLFDGQTLGVFSSPSGTSATLAPGVYGISNGAALVPWPKVERGKAGLQGALRSMPDTDAVLTLLHDDRPAADAALPATGVSQGWERLLSSIFVRAPGYGTRCSTLLTLDRDGHCQLREWTWSAEGALQGEVVLGFTAGVA